MLWCGVDPNRTKPPAIHFLFEIFKQANNDIYMRIDEAPARIRYQIIAFHFYDLVHIWNVKAYVYMIDRTSIFASNE